MIGISLSSDQIRTAPAGVRRWIEREVNQAFGRASGDASARLCGFDREGRCFIAAETQQNILRLWQKVVAGQQLASSQRRQPAAVREPDDATASSTEADVLPGRISD